MERLWAPWRMPYIVSTVKLEESGCIFCGMLAEQEDEKNLILLRGGSSFVVMNLYPYNTGHLMVVPHRHTGEFSALTHAEHLELATQLDLCQRALKDCLSPHGFNLGMNLGRAAGAGIVDHLHYHIVPRWAGDANFMTSVSETKVMSESLTATFRRIKNSIFRLNSG